jgi:hypothetical protein
MIFTRSFELRSCPLDVSTRKSKRREIGREHLGSQAVNRYCSVCKNSCHPPFMGWHFPSRQNLVTAARPGWEPRAPRLYADTWNQLRMPLRGINDPRHWRNHAEEMRGLAKAMKNSETRRIMNQLADGWDEMADRAQRRVARLDRSAVARRPADLNPKRSLH